VSPFVKKDAFLAQIAAERVIGVVAADVGEDLFACAQALSQGGINSLELAMTTPAATETLKRASERLPDFFFGLGTVLDVETARLGILAGASFIVTPSPRPAVITLCRRYHVPVISGAFSRDDIVAAHKSGADAVKVFPGEQFGPAHIRSLIAEFSNIPLIPIGGVTPVTLPEFLRAGAKAAFAGSSLITPEALRDKDWVSVKELAANFTRAAVAASA
jgi:2-dehydro-3-deoxyphosphogluconate aldolase / (4S)-4-hydroxy-2-oxoglutarate aldolase